MTKEQIEQMAERWESFECNENGAKSSFIAGANSRQQEIDELKKEVQDWKERFEDVDYCYRQLLSLQRGEVNL